MKHIHAHLGFPFCHSSIVSTLPLALSGFDFPSLTHINAGIAIDGLTCNLNHHILAYRTMALITLAGWTCQINRCVYPLDCMGLIMSFSWFVGSIPAAWIIMQDQMSKLDLTLHQTNQCQLPKGCCSISHAVSLIKLSVAQAEDLTGHTICSLHSMGVHLCHIGGWTMNTLNLTTFAVRTCPPRNWSLTQKKNWNLVKNFLSLAQTGALYSGPADLLLSRSLRW
jgi:hypothetical protein